MPLIRKTTEIPSAAGQTSEGVLKALSSPIVAERWAAARAAANIPGAPAILGNAIATESDARVREAMFTSVARSHAPESTEALVALLRSDNASLRTGALDAMRAMGPAILDKLPALLHDQDRDIRVLSCELLRHFPSGEVNGLLCGVLAVEQDVNVCAAVIDVLAEVGNADALPALTQCEIKFRDSPFLSFAIKIAVERINSYTAKQRG